MKVVVLGGLGYVGSVLYPYLVSKGHDVKVIDNCMYDQKAPVGEDVSFVKKDIRDLDESDFENTEAVINLAGLSNDPIANKWPRLNVELNTWGAIHAAKMAKEADVEVYILASTCSVYDTTDSDVQSDAVLNEDVKVDPSSNYAFSKYWAESNLSKLADSTFGVISFRKGTIYGYSPKMRFDLIVNTMVMSALSKGKIELHNKGEIWRPLIHIRDVASIYEQSLRFPGNGFGLVNMASDNFLVSDVGKIVQNRIIKHGFDCKLVNTKSPGPVRNYLVDNFRLKRFFGFVPEYGIESAVDEIVDAHEQNPFDFNDPKYYNIKYLEKHPELIK